MPSAPAQELLRTAAVSVHDVVCDSPERHVGDPCSSSPALVFPYRGVYVRYLGRDEAVAEPGQVLFENPGDAYRVAHPFPGEHAALVLRIDDAMLREIAPPTLLRPGPELAFRRQRLRIDPRAQVLVALLRHSLREGVAEPLEAESLALTLAHRALAPRTSHATEASDGLVRLVDRAKLVLASDPSRRWSLQEIGAEVGVSPVYLTQVFRQVEGVPLYRYQLRIRLARALDLLARGEDLATLGLELGFSSHSHFSAAFQQAYGRTPSEFRDFFLRRESP